MVERENSEDKTGRQERWGGRCAFFVGNIVQNGQNGNNSSMLSFMHESRNCIGNGCPFRRTSVMLLCSAEVRFNT